MRALRYVNDAVVRTGPRGGARGGRGVGRWKPSAFDERSNLRSIRENHRDKCSMFQYKSRVAEIYKEHYKVLRTQSQLRTQNK